MVTCCMPDPGPHNGGVLDITDDVKVVSEDNRKKLRCLGEKLHVTYVASHWRRSRTL